MTKELFVSSTPHETKVGMVEDDLLAEIYLERENEYTLAGSIYKGRVTRVLPGMQSAFVDIGLERDAFLYVSDFMELEDSEDLDEVPTNRPVQAQDRPQPQAREAHASGETSPRPVAAEAQPQEHSEAGPRHEACSRRDSRQSRRDAGPPPPPGTPRRAHAGIEVCQSGSRNAARGSPYGTDGTIRTYRENRRPNGIVRNGRIVPNEPANRAA